MLHCLRTDRSNLEWQGESHKEVMQFSEVCSIAESRYIVCKVPQASCCQEHTEVTAKFAGACM